MGEGSLDGGVGSCSRQGEAGGRDRACSPGKHEWFTFNIKLSIFQKFRQDKHLTGYSVLRSIVGGP